MRRTFLCWIRGKRCLSIAFERFFVPICRCIALSHIQYCVYVHAAAGNYSRHVAALLATDAIFYTIKRCQQLAQFAAIQRIISAGAFY